MRMLNRSPQFVNYQKPKHQSNIQISELVLTTNATLILYNIMKSTKANTGFSISYG